MNDPRSPLKLVLATDALSMGSNPSQVFRVIFLTGPPNSLEMFVQMSGRGGRDIQLSDRVQVTVYFDGNDLSRKYMRPDMKDFVNTEDCRRRSLLSYFGVIPPGSGLGCCDNCDSLFPHMEFSAENSVCPESLPALHTGLSPKLAEEIAQNFEVFMSSADALKDLAPFLSTQIQHNIRATLRNKSV